jgi:hypothetical protein
MDPDFIPSLIICIVDMFMGKYFHPIGLFDGAKAEHLSDTRFVLRGVSEVGGRGENSVCVWGAF